MYILRPTSRFRKDVRLLNRRGYDLDKLNAAQQMLADKGELPTQYKPHPLRGNWKGCWDAHIAPDWILIYEIDGESIILRRTGSHSDLF